MKRAIALLGLSALILLADVSEPGYGRFINPVFYGRWAVNGIQDKLANADAVDPTDARLKGCEGGAAPVAITDAQAATRKTLAGKSSVVAVQALGSPACQLANGSYRWLLKSGLSLDVAVNKDGRIKNADLSR